MKKWAALILILSFVLLVQPDVIAQCQMCKSNIEMARQNGDTNVGNTLNNGILYLLALPYLIAIFFGFIYYKKYKEKKAAQSLNTQA